MYTCTIYYFWYIYAELHCNYVLTANKAGPLKKQLTQTQDWRLIKVQNLMVLIFKLGKSTSKLYVGATFRYNYISHLSTRTTSSDSILHLKVSKWNQCHTCNYLYFINFKSKLLVILTSGWIFPVFPSFSAISLEQTKISLSNIIILSKLMMKKIQVWTGIEPMTSAIPVQLFNQLSYQAAGGWSIVSS